MEQTITFLTFIFITAFTPGPNNILAMSNAQRYGLKKSLRFILGVAVGFSAVVAACVVFNLALYQLLPTAKVAMSVLGAAYLVYLAVKIFLGRRGGEAQDLPVLSSFRSGVFLQFVNAKIYLYALTAFSSFVIPRFGPGRPLFLFALFLTFVGVLGTVVWALFGSLFQKLLAKHSEPFNVVMSLLLLYCAASITLSIFH